MSAHFYFKLFNSIKEEHEIDLAELELLSMFGRVERIKNFADVIDEEPLRNFITEEIRIQDILTHELPYGRFQGFYGFKEEIPDITTLVRRLAYIREIVMITEGRDPQRILQKVFPFGTLGKNVVYFQKQDNILFRFITNQYFLEKSQYISKISRNEDEIDRNVETLFKYLIENLYRIPATETMAVGKRLEDYFAIREELSLYLTHYMHPYKGKFHPKMVRALLNYVYPEEKGKVMDNFAGSGTLLVEATLMGLDSVGVEINPLSVLMSNVKCFSLNLKPRELSGAIQKFLKEVENALQCLEKYLQKYRLLAPQSLKQDLDSIREYRKKIPSKLAKMFKDPSNIERILLTREIINKIENEKIKNFLLLGLSGTISDLTRRRGGEFLEVLRDRLQDLYRRIYLFHKLNEVLKIELGNSETYVGDTRDMKNSCRRIDGERVKIDDNSIDAIVNSPPYSTALDYIRNDFPQLVLLNLVLSLEKLETDMIGNPNLRYYPRELLNEIEKEHEEYRKLSPIAKESINRLIQAGRIKEALRTYKFFKDMHASLIEMYRVMKPGSKCVIIIGNNHYKLDGNYEEIKNDEVIVEIAKKEKFKVDKIIKRELEKTMAGMIRYESIVILQKEVMI